MHTLNGIQITFSFGKYAIAKCICQKKILSRVFTVLAFVQEENVEYYSNSNCKFISYLDFPMHLQNVFVEGKREYY